MCKSQGLSNQLIKNFEVKMVDYKCFSCSKIVADTYIKKKVRCPYCGSRLIFKPRTSITKVKAR